MRFDFKIDAAIFDNDGTLMDTMPYWRYTTLEFLLAHQMPVPNEMLVSMYDSSSRKLLTQICEETGVMDVEAAVSEVEGYMHRHYLYDAKLKSPAVPELLGRLKAGGARLCVATAAPREYVSDGLRRLVFPGQRGAFGLSARKQPDQGTGSFLRPGHGGGSAL